MNKFIALLRANKLAVVGLISATLTIVGVNADIVGAVTNLVALSF